MILVVAALTPSHLHFFLYLDDCIDDGQGATQFVPGSHKNNRYPTDDDLKDAVSVYAKKGSLIVLNSAIYHGSSKKSSMGKRKLLTFAFSRWFIRQQFSIPTLRLASHPYRRRKAYFRLL